MNNDFGRMKATDMKQNKRIHLPKDSDIDLKARMEMKNIEAGKIFDECAKLLMD